MRFFRYKTVILLSILALTAIGILGASTYYQVSTFDHKSLKELSSSFLLAQKNFSLLADLIYKNHFHDRPEILALIAKANDVSQGEKAKVRKEIIKKLYKHYGLLRHLGVKQFHIHLADGTSFIRFHRLDKWGDSLIGVRKTVEMVMHTHQNVRGFEEGRIFSGFRNVYPLGYKGKYIGSVEISAGLSAIAMMMANPSEHMYIQFILSRKLTGKKVFKDELKDHYQITPFASNFVTDKSPYETGTFLRVNFEEDYFAPLIKRMAQGDLNQILSNYTPSYKYYWVGKKLFQVFFIPFKEFQGAWAGFMVVAKEAFLTERILKLFIYQGILTFAVFLGLGSWLVRQEHKLLYYSSRDALTGVFNRRNGLLELKRSVALAQRTGMKNSIIFFDIDDFKMINDRYGHKLGDKVLQSVAFYLRDTLRETDVIIRYGGEEFIVLLPNTDLLQALNVAEKLRKGIEGMDVGHGIRLTISIGVAEHQQGESVHEWINRADRAMYKSKQTGKNQVNIAK